MNSRQGTRSVLAATALLVVAGATAASQTGHADAAGAKSAAAPAPAYDLVIENGHVIDPKNGIDKVMDVAITGKKIAAVADDVDASRATKTVDAKGMYVTPGLVDMHTHLFTGRNKAYASGHLAVAPDGFTFRSGVTTVVDAGSPGWRNIDEYRAQVIDRSKTRVLTMLNIVGHGMAGDPYEQNLKDMQVAPTARAAKENSDIVVGIKTAHYEGPEWTPVERSVQAGKQAKVPVMVDFGNNHPERPLAELVTKKLRPGDVYAHMYSGLRDELIDGKINPGMKAGRERGVKFEVGHGGGSFKWQVAAEGVKEGFKPDVISTDLHIDSMNSGMKDMSNVMSKFLALGLPLKEVIADATWNPAQTIKHKELGNLDVGAAADVAVFSVNKGKFGFIDSAGYSYPGKQKLVAELTVRDGSVAWDLNGLAATPWKPGVEE